MSKQVSKKLIERASIEHARRRLIAKGNPLPLIKQQWPCIDLDDFQRDILRSMFSPTIREVFAKGCTSSGKTSAVALGCAAYLYAFDDAKIVLTSVSFDHATSVLFAEVVRWFNQMKLKPTGASVLASGISIDKQHYCEVINPGAGEGFSGRHGEHVLFVFDEASGVPDDRFRLAATQATKFVALANPRTLSGLFRSGFDLCDDRDVTQTVLGPYGQRRCITIAGADCINVSRKRLQQPIGPIGGITISGTTYKQGEPIPAEHYEQVKPLIPGQLTYDVYMAHAANPDERWAACFAHGKFADEDPDVQLILGSWLGRHVQAWTENKPDVTTFSVDPAASDHGDSTVMAAGSESGCRALHVRQRADLMATCGWVISTAREQYGIDLTKRKHPVVIDIDGLGKGLADRLKELGVQVHPFRGNNSPKDPKAYKNLRAEAYAMLANRLDPNGKHAEQTWAMPADEMLHQDLTAPEKLYDSDGFKFRISPKTRQPGMPANIRTIAEKLGRSPDRGDAVVYLHWAFRPRRKLYPGAESDKTSTPSEAQTSPVTAEDKYPQCCGDGCWSYVHEAGQRCCDTCSTGRHTSECMEFSRKQYDKRYPDERDPDPLVERWNARQSRYLGIGR